MNTTIQQAIEIELVTGLLRYQETKELVSGLGKIDVPAYAAEGFEVEVETSCWPRHDREMCERARNEVNFK